MNVRLPALLAALAALTACVGVKVEPVDSADPELVRLDEAPPPRAFARVHDGGGAFLRELELGEDANWGNNLASGVLSIAVSQGSTLLQITLWQSFEEGDSFPVVAVSEGGGLPDDATLTFLDEGTAGGAATAGTFTITGWTPTDSPQVKLLDATFEAAPVLNPDEPESARDLREGLLEAVRVTAF